MARDRSRRSEPMSVLRPAALSLIRRGVRARGSHASPLVWRAADPTRHCERSRRRRRGCSGLIHGPAAEQGPAVRLPRRLGCPHERSLAGWLKALGARRCGQAPNARFEQRAQSGPVVLRVAWWSAIDRPNEAACASPVRYCRKGRAWTPRRRRPPAWCVRQPDARRRCLAPRRCPSQPARR